MMTPLPYKPIPIIDWCLHESMLPTQQGSLRLHAALHRCRFAISFGLLLGPLLILLCILRLWQGAALDMSIMLVFGGAVLAFGLPIQLRWTGLWQPMLGYFIVAGLVLYPIRAIGMGGLDSAVMAWAIVPALLATQLGGFRVGVISAIILVAEIFGIMMLHDAGRVPTVETTIFGEAATVSACVIFITGLAVSHDAWRRTHESYLSRAMLHLEQTNQALETKTEEAQAANHAKDAFLGNMSHEIRTPLNGVIGMAHVLEQTPLNDHQREIVQTMRQSAGLLMHVLNDLLDLSRLDQDQLSIETSPFSLTEAIHHITALYQAQATQAGLELTLDLDPNLPTRQLGDRHRIQQVMGHLLSNAIKFTPSGQITLTARMDAATPAEVVLEVRDTGIGIPAERHEAIFERFTQAEVRVTREYGGVGLGLSLCRSLVEKMGGTIVVESTPGEGSVFRIRLPLPSPQPLTVLNGAPQPLRVLLAEDNLINQRVATCILRQIGLNNVDIAVDGVEALQMMSAADGGYDLVILDIEMPRMDGITAARLLREQHPELPIIGLSAHAVPELKAQGIAAGMDDYLTKPLQPDVLTQTLDRLVGPHRKHA